MLDYLTPRPIRPVPAPAAPGRRPAARMLPRLVASGPYQLARQADERGMGNRATLDALASAGIRVTSPQEPAEQQAAATSARAASGRPPAVTAEPMPLTSPAGATDLPPAFSAALQGGSPVPAAVRDRVEPFVGAGLERTRVHSGTAAQEVAAAVGARAFTVGRDIVLGAGERADDVPLLAHEATHVVQQGAAPRAVMRDKSSKAPARRAPKDKPIDVLEAVVHMMSNRGLWGDVGPNGENLSSPYYARDVARTVQEPDNTLLLWAWHRIATGHPTAHANRQWVEDAHNATAPLLAAALADPKAKRAARTLKTAYDKGVEELRQRAAREQVDDMLATGIAAGRAATALDPAHASEDDRLRAGIGQARRTLTEVVALERRMLAAFTSDRLRQAAQAKADVRPLEIHYERTFNGHVREVMVGTIDKIPQPTRMNFSDGVHFFKGGLDAMSAILTVTDPKAREQLFRKHESFFGNVGQGAAVNLVFWQFISGTIALGGAGVYAMAKLAGNANLAAGVLEATVKGVANVAGVMNLAGLVHSADVLLDPDATVEQKAEAAVEVASSAIGLAGFASRWLPSLAGAARWSGPVAASLWINLKVFKHLHKLQAKAVVGMTRLDWAHVYRALDTIATDVQASQRMLATAAALLAQETDPRRRKALTDYATAFRFSMIELELEPFLTRVLNEKNPDRLDFIGTELRRRLEPSERLLSKAKQTDEAALTAGATFLLAIDTAFRDWDKIIMMKEPAPAGSKP